MFLCPKLHPAPGSNRGFSFLLRAVFLQLQVFRGGALLRKLAEFRSFETRARLGAPCRSPSRSFPLVLRVDLASLTL